MRELNWGKRPREEHDNVGLSENTKRQRGDNNASTGFGSGPAGRHHFRFTGTATIHLNLNIETLSKEIEQRHDIAVQRHEEQDLELRLGPPSAQRETPDFLAQFGRTPDQILGKHQSEISQASSSRQPFGWQGQEAFHRVQTHQETRPSSQQEEINEQMPLETSSDSESEPSHARPLVIREPRHEMHHQAHDDGTTSSASRPERSHKELQKIAKAFIEAKSYKNLPQEMKEKIKGQPFSDSEYESIWKEVKSQLPNNKERKNMQIVLYYKSNAGKAAKRGYQQSEKGKASKRKYDQSEKGKATRKKRLENKNQSKNLASHLELTWME